MEHGHVVDGVIALVGLLLIAAIAAIGLKRARLPYTVGLVLVGLGLGGLAGQYESFRVLTQIELSPELILFVFLPTLVFESAFALDSGLLTRNLTPILALAAPGLLLSTAIVGGLITLLTPLPLGPALVFGALISATDPVAVVALFREVGAPKRLAVLVEGESLFNDATAIVLFHLLVGVAAGGAVGALTLAHGAVDFLFVFTGGILVGSAIGYLMVRSIALAGDEPIVEVALSTVVAYAAFIAAEHYLHVSGVMATVGAGIIVASMGATRFSPEIRAYLHQYWEFAAFVANSLIFLLVGLSVRASGLVEHWRAILWAIVAATLARAFTTFFVLPIVSRGGERIGVRYQAVIFWGGLRGAVALALATSLAPDFAYRELIISMAVGVVLFTLLMGGMTMSPLIRVLGLNRPTVVERVARAQARLAAKREGLDRINKMAEAGHFSDRLIGEIRQEYEDETWALDVELVALKAECAGSEMRQALWAEAVSVESRGYRDAFDRGAISELVLRQLELSIDVERDALKRGEVTRVVPDAVPPEIRFADAVYGAIGKLLPRLRMVQRHRLRALAARHEHDSAVLEASRRVTDEVNRLAETRGADEIMAKELHDSYAERGRRALERIDSIAEHFPEYARAVQRQAARRTALDGEADAVERLAATGAIPESVATQARHSVEHAIRELQRQPIVAPEPKPEELLGRVPFFERLADEDRRRVVERLVPRTALAGEAVIRQGEAGTSLFLIARGVVAVMVRANGTDKRVASLHAGDFFGEMALLTAERRTATVRAISACQLYELSKTDVDALREHSAGVDEALVSAYQKRKADLREQTHPPRAFEREPND